MKKEEVVTQVSGTFNKVSFQLKKHSPEILIVAGIVGTVASTVIACRATTKAGKIIDKAKSDANEIHIATENGVTKAGENYSVEDSKKDLSVVYLQTGAKFAKLYAPAVALGTLSIASILASNNILRKRNVALAAAYATVDKSFKEYRKRVVERFGKEIDRELKYNIKAEKVSETVIDEETGKEKKVKKTAFVVNPSDVSGYARFFEKYTLDEEGNGILNPHWESNNEYNLMFLKAQEKYANDLLRAKKRLFLNDVYDMLGLPQSKAGQIVGWVYDAEHPVGDNYVDFGLYVDNLNYSDFVNGSDPAILLDFNVDGNIWELM